ncbi:MAG: TRAP transporter TatT component family protein [bacterium]
MLKNKLFLSGFGRLLTTYHLPLATLSAVLRRPLTAYRLPLTAVFLLSGCSMRTMAVRSTAEIIKGGMPAYLEEKDPDFAEESMPSSLKLMEILLKNDPRNASLLENLAQGYCGYSLMFMEDEFPERASGFYARGEYYGMTALRERRLSGGEKASIAVEKARADDVPALFWTAFCKAGRVQLHLDEPEAIAELVRIVPLLERVLALDPGYYNNGAHAVMGAYHASRPRILGGDTEKAKKHFEASLEGRGNSFQMNRFMYAKKGAVAMQDRDLFENLLKEVIASGSPVPDQALANEVARRKAKKLLEKADELF